MVGGWAVGVYLIQILWQNIRTLLVNYQSSVLAYIACTGLVSFGICYRFGPVTDQRSKNLIKWMMQVQLWKSLLKTNNCLHFFTWNEFIFSGNSTCHTILQQSISRSICFIYDTIASLLQLPTFMVFLIVGSMVSIYFLSSAMAKYWLRSSWKCSRKSVS